MRYKFTDDDTKACVELVGPFSIALCESAANELIGGKLKEGQSYVVPSTQPIEDSFYVWTKLKNGEYEGSARVIWVEAI